MRVHAVASGVTSALFIGSALGLRIPVKDINERREAGEQLEALFHEQQKREICVQDDTLMSLEMFTDDSYPFCSSYLGIEPVTATATTRVRGPTVTVLQTTYQTVDAGYVTVPAVTVTAAPVPNAQPLVKRQGTITATPVASIAMSCSLSPQNASLISMVSSACSCLFLPTTTNYVDVTVTSTRYLSGTDYEQTTVESTVTSGTTTITPTFTPSFSIPDPNQSRQGPPTTTATVDATSIGSSLSSYLTTFDVTSSQLISTTSSSAPAPSATLPYTGCPNINGGHYYCECEEYEILCNTQFVGAMTQGIYEPDVFKCIDVCVDVNKDFSDDVCYGVTFYPYSGTENNCFLVQQAATLGPVPNNNTIAAKIVDPDYCVSSSSMSSTLSLTGSQSLTNTIATASITTSSSLPIPTPPFSIPVGSRTGGALPSSSGSPIPSLNSTLPTGTASIPIPPFSIPLGSRTGGLSSGTPTPSLNSSSPSGTGVPSYSFTLPSFNTTSPTGTGSIPIPPFSIPLGSRTGGLSSGTPTPSLNSTAPTGTGSIPIPPFSIPLGSRTGGLSSGTPTPSLNSSSPSGTGVPSYSFTLPSLNTTSPTGTGSIPIPPFSIPLGSRTGALPSSSGTPLPSTNATSTAPASSGSPSASANSSSTGSIPIPPFSIPLGSRTGALPSSSGTPTPSSNSSSPSGTGVPSYSFAFPSISTPAAPSNTTSPSGTGSVPIPPFSIPQGSRTGALPSSSGTPSPAVNGTSITTGTAPTSSSSVNTTVPTGTGSIPVPPFSIPLGSRTGAAASSSSPNYAFSFPSVTPPSSAPSASATASTNATSTGSIPIPPFSIPLGSRTGALPSSSGTPEPSTNGTSSGVGTGTSGIPTPSFSIPVGSRTGALPSSSGTPTPATTPAPPSSCPVTTCSTTSTIYTTFQVDVPETLTVTATVTVTIVGD